MASITRSATCPISPSFSLSPWVSSGGASSCSGVSASACGKVRARGKSASRVAITKSSSAIAVRPASAALAAATPRARIGARALSIPNAAATLHSAAIALSVGTIAARIADTDGGTSASLIVMPSSEIVIAIRSVSAAGGASSSTPSSSMTTPIRAGERSVSPSRSTTTSPWSSTAISPAVTCGAVRSAIGRIASPPCASASTPGR